ncbi:MULTISPECIES: N-acetylglucosamine-specific PTS transporter subunit IIBC [unclassified Sphingomonas]|uniref:N-acetylglucosamine-specific PTS transporter subunit IIBC n=1 Tax=unclassified Sphingomonas TaxID=196159 RepID=UPI000E74AA72|nr:MULTISPECIES: N-acetylglucosamine-specific PTS transporter subunit IIBC [unclassified Sphingomonas]RKE53364.1 PTS system N-acetylglucosamine-specific IIB component (Glc family) /PTS system N-acetylglucosamine-specific IIC component (Glc family) [Sphingomonas sp. PP-CC-1A-547]TCM09859.1 PTS system N-acetylglucosamine-specific IIB component (Glc family) /PTS system N-acetylglucosamine-specific IIC component (Glc family) [Sphingomonas sp. PP-CC-3G-468]
MKSILEALQPLGRALMLPIAVLPIAGLLLRLGQPDLLDIAFISAAGDAIFSHLGLLFAIGVATGFARDGNGAACLAGVVCFLVATEAGKVLITVAPEVSAGLTGVSADLAIAAWKAKAMARLDVPIGILSGLAGGTLYNRYSTIKLPEYLAFFGGRRFVPIVSGVAGLVLAAVFGFGFSLLSQGVDQLSVAITGSGAIGVFVFGLLNRLLLVTGLHHLLNNIVWFVAGDYHGTSGDLRRFFAGDPSAGIFMAGFFPVMMFGLPAACLAMYHSAKPERRKAVGGMLLSLALTSALTGVTEPIEFSFMFLAPVLYAVHAVLTGLSMALMDLLGVKMGFGFSAGLLDYVLNFGKATRPLVLLPVGALYFVLYYGLFRFFIRKFDLATPGREAETVAAVATPAAGGRGAAFAQALGGGANLTTVSACTTRLRLIVVDQSAVDDAALKALGARGILRPSNSALQVVLGPIADVVSMEIRDALALGGDVAIKPAAPVVSDSIALSSEIETALGGATNVLSASRHTGRLRVQLSDLALADDAALVKLGIRAIARPAPGQLHALATDAVLTTLTR